MKDLNRLENEILIVIAREYPIIELHIPYLKVESREHTGVGMYVNFSYINLGKGVKPIEDGLLSVNKIISLNSLVNGLGFTLDISNGLINFIEIFTYDDETWDGSFTMFEFTDI
jgi:hypothetical protein